MNRFDACSRWDECSKVMQCVHPGADNIPAQEWEKACTTAYNYKKGINHLAVDKNAKISQNFKPEYDNFSAQQRTNKKTGRFFIDEEKPSKLLIIDGNSVINKAFYGTPELNAPDGRPTNGIYGSLKTIIAAVTARGPNHLLVAMDHPGKTFRHVLYPKYKAGRLATPDDLALQLTLMREVFNKIGITYIEKEGYEADDIIGTAAEVAVKNNFLVEILTSDKDCLQLVSDKTTVLLHNKGRFIECTPHTTTLVAGYYHYWTVDIKALAGDPSDSIPGASRIGKKTALSLLREYGSLKKVLAEAHNIPGKIGANIRNNREVISLSEKLATIDTAVPLEVTLKALALPIGGNRSYMSAAKYLKQLGIRVLKLETLFDLTKSEQAVQKFSPPVARIEIKIPGSKILCGVCQTIPLKSANCAEYIELDDNGRLCFGARKFFACEQCGKLLHPNFYLRIPDKASKPGKVHKETIKNALFK